MGFLSPIVIVVLIMCKLIGLSFTCYKSKKNISIHVIVFFLRHDIVVVKSIVDVARTKTLLMYKESDILFM